MREICTSRILWEPRGANPRGHPTRTDGKLGPSERPKGARWPVSFQTPVAQFSHVSEKSPDQLCTKSPPSHQLDQTTGRRLTTARMSSKCNRPRVVSASRAACAHVRSMTFQAGEKDAMSRQDRPYPPTFISQILGGRTVAVPAINKSASAPPPPLGGY